MLLQTVLLYNQSRKAELLQSSSAAHKDFNPITLSGELCNEYLADASEYHCRIGADRTSVNISRRSVGRAILQ